MTVLSSYGQVLGATYSGMLGASVPGQPAKQSSIFGRPIAIVYGTHRVTGNILISGYYIVNLTDVAKWGYSGMLAGLAQIGICEGPISEILSIWVEKTKNTPAGYSVTVQTGAGITAYSAAVTYPAGAWVSSAGTNYVSIQAGNLNHTPASSPTWWAARGSATTERAQSPWATMTSSFPKLALGYGGTAIACSTTWSTNAISDSNRASFEVSGRFTTATGSAQNVHPASVIVDLLTNAEYGLGLPTSMIDGYAVVGGIPRGFTAGIDGTSATSYYDFVTDGGMNIAMAIEEQRPAREIIDEIARATDSLVLWSGGVLKMRPLGDWEGATYSGSTALVPVADLGAEYEGADFLADEGDDPIEVERSPLKDHFNCYPIEWSNRAPARKDVTGTSLPEPFNAYNAWLEEGTPDPVDVSKYGVLKAPPTTLRCIVTEAHAKYISGRFVQRSLYSRNVYRFRLGWRWCLLEPSDLVTVTYATLGVNRQLVRIMEIEEDEDGTFSIVAEEVGTTLVAGYPLLTVTLSAAVVDNYPYATLTTAPVTAMPHGGSGSFTYSWTYVSGDTMTIDAASLPTTTFTRATIIRRQGIFRCTVTDTVTTQTATADVTAIVDVP